MGDRVEAEPSLWIEECNGKSLRRVGMKRKGRSKKLRFVGWGSEQLIEFLQSIGEDTSKQLSQYDVTDIIIKYVNGNNLNDPNKKRKINCDEKLHSLFRRKRIGRFKIHDMLESHFAENQEESPDNFSDSSEDEYAGRANGQKNIWSSERKTPNEKKVLEVPKSIFAAIVPDNLKLVYLKKSLVQKLLSDPETVEGKLVGSFVRVKSDPNDYYQKNSHKLLQVTGLKKTSQTNSKSTGTNGMSSEIALQVSNYVKEICISVLSDDNFSQEECEDLHQRVKDGLLGWPTIVEFEAKAKILHEDITRHWLAGELDFLQKRIDRANEKGWRRQLYEYRDRRQVLENPDEQSRLLSKVPKVIADCSEAEVVTPDFPGAVEQSNDGSAKPAVLKGACEIDTSDVPVATATAGTLSTKMYFSADNGEDLHAPAQVERKLSTEGISGSNDNVEPLMQLPESKSKMDSKVQPIDMENSSNVVINEEVIDLSADEENEDPHCNGQAFEKDMIGEMVCTSGGSVTRSKAILGVHPGPQITTVLGLQSTHRSEDVWDGNALDPLYCRHHKPWPLHDSIRPLIQRAGFLGLSQIGYIPLNHALLTALVERWRQETHTFHFVVGEMTITLEDVAMLQGLRIDGLAVTGQSICLSTWDDYCFLLLGVRPTGRAISGTSLKLSWLHHNFSQLPHAREIDPVVLEYHARAYIMCLFGSILFPDSSGDTVPLLFLPLLQNFDLIDTYSWGSATLAWLYRSLCRASHVGVSQLGGNLSLLQLWSWERLHVGRPIMMVVEDVLQFNDDILPPLGASWSVDRTTPNLENPRVLTFYRHELDGQAENQVIWQPYTESRLLRVSPNCLRDCHLWRARVPLICFAFVEWHLPNRVVHQFGIGQHIPENFDTDRSLHAYDRRGRHDTDWVVTHQQYITLWDQRHAHIVMDHKHDDTYMQWYRSITRLRIAPPRQVDQPAEMESNAMIGGLHSIARRCMEVIRDSTQTAIHVFANEILCTCRSTLDGVGDSFRYEMLEPSPTTRGRGRGRGRGRRGWARRDKSVSSTQPPHTT